MPTQISLDEIIDSTTSFKINLYYFTISGSAIPKAKETFLSIMELDKFNIKNPYLKIIECLSQTEREEFSSIKDDDSIAYLNKFIMRNDLDSISTLEHKFLVALSSRRCININKMFMDMISQSITNGSFEIEFNENDNIAQIDTKSKQRLLQDIKKCTILPEVAEYTFEYYKKDYLSIYASLATSVYYFLESLK